LVGFDGVNVTPQEVSIVTKQISKKLKRTPGFKVLGTVKNTKKRRCADLDCWVMLGNKFKANLIITGELIRTGNAKSILIQVVDVASEQVIYSNTEDCYPCFQNSALLRLAEGMAEKIGKQKNFFPEPSSDFVEAPRVNTATIDSRAARRADLAAEKQRIAEERKRIKREKEELAREKREEARRIREEERIRKEEAQMAREIENIRLEDERLAREREKRESLKQERLDREREKQERIDAERSEKERAEQAKLDAEQRERDRIENERLRREKLERERIEQAKQDSLKRVEEERIRVEKARQDSIRAAEIEAKRVAKIKADSLVKAKKIAKIEVKKAKKEAKKKAKEAKIAAKKARQDSIARFELFNKCLADLTSEKESDRNKAERLLVSDYKEEVYDSLIKNLTKHYPYLVDKSAELLFKLGKREAIKPIGESLYKYGNPENIIKVLESFGGDEALQIIQEFNEKEEDKTSFLKQQKLDRQKKLNIKRTKGLNLEAERQKKLLDEKK